MLLRMEETAAGWVVASARYRRSHVIPRNSAVHVRVTVRFYMTSKAKMQRKVPLAAAVAGNAAYPLENLWGALFREVVQCVPAASGFGQISDCPSNRRHLAVRREPILRGRAGARGNYEQSLATLWYPEVASVENFPFDVVARSFQASFEAVVSIVLSEAGNILNQDELRAKRAGEAKDFKYKVIAWILLSRSFPFRG